MTLQVSGCCSGVGVIMYTFLWVLVLMSVLTVLRLEAVVIECVSLGVSRDGASLVLGTCG